MPTIPQKYPQPEVSTSRQVTTADIDHLSIRTLQPATIVSLQGFRSAVATRCHVGPSLGKLLNYKTAVELSGDNSLCCDGVLLIVGALLEDTDGGADGTAVGGCDGATIGTDDKLLCEYERFVGLFQNDTAKAGQKEPH